MLYPTDKQRELIDQTIGCCRFVHNQTLADCGAHHDRDVNAAKNILNQALSVA